TVILVRLVGEIADYRAIKKRMLAVFIGIGVVTTILMGPIGRGEWMYAAVLFMISNIAIASSFVLYDSPLPPIAGPHERDRVSSGGYAIGYCGGGILLVINLLWILTPTTFGIPDTITGIKLSVIRVGLWWLGL